MTTLVDAAQEDVKGRPKQKESKEEQKGAQLKMSTRNAVPSFAAATWSCWLSPLLCVVGGGLPVLSTSH